MYNVPNRKQPATTPVAQQAHPNQVKNDAGGFVFQADDWQRFERFLLLGVLGGDYYASEEKRLDENIPCAVSCIKQDGVRAVKLIADVSNRGLALKNEPAILALALVFKHGDEAAKRAAKNAVNVVCRTGTHILHLTTYINKLCGWGRSKRAAIANWYMRKAEDLAYQVAKYQQRDGMSHKDVLRLVHVNAKDNPAAAGVLNWIVKGAHPENGQLPASIIGLEAAKQATSADEIVRLIRNYRLTREMIPTQWLTDRTVMRELFETMPLTAMVRNLGNLSKAKLTGMVKDSITSDIIARLSDADYLKRGRMHPISLLIAMAQYSEGKGLRGSNAWEVDSKIVSALDEAFYKTMNFVSATNKRILYALDISGSMDSHANGVENMSCRDIGIALGLVMLNVEPNVRVSGFGSKFYVDLGITKRTQLKDAFNKVAQFSEGTNASTVLEWALARQDSEPYDAIVVFTDGQIWEGKHLFQMFNQYKRKSPNCKLIMVAAQANGFSMSDTSDPNYMQIAGFSQDVPQLINSFISI